MEVLEYKCPNCSAPLTFNTDTQKMKCGSCDADIDVKVLRQYNEELKAADEKTNWEEYKAQKLDNESFSAFLCESCGGELVTDENTVATECPYCNNSAIISNRVSDILRPDMVIPFKLDKNAAKKTLGKFYKNKLLLPKFFKDENRINKITGIYVPFWLYDCDTASHILYDATRVKSWRSGNFQFIKTEHWLVTRDGELEFSMIPADGSEKMDDTLMEAIEPYNYDELIPFATAYLSGYLADKYDVDAEKNKPRINERIRNSVQAEFSSTVRGYSSVVPKDINIQIKNGKIYYTLLPVWILNTKYKDKLYTFAMNGQTGKLIGKLPVDWGKAAMWFCGIFAASAGVFIGFSSLF